MKKLLQMRVLWLLLTMCSLAYSNSHAQSLNERLIKAIDKGKYDEAKKLILRGASPFYVDKPRLKGEKPPPSFLSALYKNMKVKSKRADKQLGEVALKFIFFPIVLGFSAIDSNPQKHINILDYSLEQPDTPQKYEFIQWFFEKGARTKINKQALMRCAIKGKNIRFIEKLLKLGYRARVDITFDETGLTYIIKHYPNNKKLLAAKLLLHYGANPLDETDKPVALVAAIKAHDKPMTQLFLRYLSPKVVQQVWNPVRLFSELVALDDVSLIQKLIDKGFKWRKARVLSAIFTINLLDHESQKKWLQYFTQLSLKTRRNTPKPYKEISWFLAYVTTEHYAKRQELLQYLLEQGANPLMNVAINNQDPLSLCLAERKIDDINLLLKYCKPSDIKSTQNNHVVLAAHYYNLRLAHKLMRMGFDWKKPIPEETNPLYIYTLNNKYAMGVPPSEELLSIQLLKKSLLKQVNLNTPILYLRRTPTFADTKFYNPLSWLYEAYKAQPKDSIHRSYFYQKATILLNQGANPLLDHGKGSMLDNIIKKQDWDVFHFLIKRVTPTQVAQCNSNPIKEILSLKDFNPKYVQVLIDKGIDWKTKNKQGRHFLKNLLTRTYDQEVENLLSFFLENGARFPKVIAHKFADPLGFLLHNYRKDYDTKYFTRKAKILLHYEANPLKKEGKLKSALEQAIDLRATSVVKLFLGHITLKQVAQHPLIVSYAVNIKNNALSGHIIQMLIEKGFYWDKKNILSKQLIANKKNAYYHTQDYTFTLGYLLTHKANPNQLINQKYTLLAKAVEGYLKSSSREDGYTKRHYRLMRNLIDTLLNHQANPIIPTNDSILNTKQYTALHWAIAKKNQQLVRKLLVNVSPTQAQQASHSYLRLAYRESTWKILLTLIKKGFNWRNFLTHQKGNILHQTLQNTSDMINTKRALRYFLNQGARVNFIDSAGTTPLSLLIKQRPHQLSLVRLLIKYGADLKQSPRGHDAIAEAKYWMKQKPTQQADYQKLIKLLEKAWKRKYTQPYIGKE